MNTGSSCDDDTAEAVRQQDFLAALVRDDGGLPAGLVPLPGPRGQASRDEGLQSYQRNALAHAVRALLAAYPTVAALLGEEALTALARDMWRDHPPQRGDLAWFGAELPGLLEAHAAYAAWPWLADVARLDWAVHLAQTAADTGPQVEGLANLGLYDPATLRLRLTPGSQPLDSAWPIEALWRAHQVTDPAARAPLLAEASEALAQGRRDAVWVHRRGGRVQVWRWGTAAEHRFTRLILSGASLGVALDEVLAPAECLEPPAEAGPVFSFAQWLALALRQGWLAAVEPVDPARFTEAPASLHPCSD